MISYNYVDNHFWKANGFDYNLNWLIIDYFGEKINNSKNRVIVIAFSIY